MDKLRISIKEHRQRQEKLLEELDRRGLAGACLFGSIAIKYLTGFSFIPTERPMALVLTKDEAIMYVPQLEEEHCLIDTALDRSVSYPEYPGEIHSIYTLRDLLIEINLDEKKIGADAGGYPNVFGYEGPSLKEMLPNIEIENIAYHIVEMRMVKSENEIKLIKASAKWGDRAHELLQKYTVAGASEIQVSMRASMEATREMIETLGDKYVAMGGKGVSAGYRGQIGPHSALPHSQTINAIFQLGDTLVTGAGGDLVGYRSELERTMFVGKPSDIQRKYFDLMYEAQQIAFSAIKPGEPYSVVDYKVRDFFDKHDLWEYWRHHQGHNIGLEGHEAPFFDIGDDSIMTPGMVVCVEPGIYVPGLGGFRHSDTAIITNDGCEILTHYPRELKDLICE